MQKDAPVARCLILPALVCGITGAAAAFAFTASWIAATAVIASSLAGGGISAWCTRRSNRLAGARLRHSELRNRLTGLGLYQTLMQEAVTLLAKCEQECATTARQKTELEARSRLRLKSMRQLEAALRALQQPVIITNVLDQPIFWNTAAARLFGVDRAAPVANNDEPQPQLDGFPELAALVNETRVRNAATNSRQTEFEVRHGEHSAPYRATAVTVGDTDGSLLGVVTFLEDISDERCSRTRHAEFVSSVCHELKTPLAGIKAYVEMLADGDVEDVDEQQEMYGFIDDQIDRLTRMVNNMLNLARIESGVIKINRIDCELNDVLQKAAEVIGPPADEKQITFSAQLSKLYCPVHVDEDLFGQAIINLLSNAVKYTPQGGEVRLRSQMDEHSAVIEIRDNGLGIPAESLPHIFDRFYRVPENNNAAQGTGLGLSLVHYIVTELHNGTIAVDSTVGEGTCFTVTIPLGHVDEGRKRNGTHHPHHNLAECLQ